MNWMKLCMLWKVSRSRNQLFYHVNYLHWAKSVGRDIAAACNVMKKQGQAIVALVGISEMISAP